MFSQIKKMQDRVQRTKDEVQKCREKYEQALQEINKYNPIYMEDMTSVFIKCQEMEETRLRFFKNVLFSIHKSLNVTQDPKYVASIVMKRDENIHVTYNYANLIFLFVFFLVCRKFMRNSTTQSIILIIKKT